MQPRSMEEVQEAILASVGSLATVRTDLEEILTEILRQHGPQESEEKRLNLGVFVAITLENLLDHLWPRLEASLREAAETTEGELLSRKWSAAERAHLERRFGITPICE